MTNNKQQTAVEWFIEQLEYKGDLRETPSIRNIQLNIDTSDYMELKVQAKEMEKEQKRIKLPSHYEILDKADEEDDKGKHYAFIRGERMIDFANNCIKQIEVSDTCELLMVESPKDLYQETYGGGEQ